MPHSRQAVTQGGGREGGCHDKWLPKEEEEKADAATTTAEKDDEAREMYLKQ